MGKFVGKDFCVATVLIPSRSAATDPRLPLLDLQVCRIVLSRVVASARSGLEVVSQKFDRPSLFRRRG